MKNGVNWKCRVSTCSFCKSNSGLSVEAGLCASVALFLPAQNLESAYFRTPVNFDKFINWLIKCHRMTPLQLKPKPRSFLVKQTGILRNDILGNWACNLLGAITLTSESCLLCNGTSVQMVRCPLGRNLKMYSFPSTPGQPRPSSCGACTVNHTQGLSSVFIALVD